MLFRPQALGTNIDAALSQEFLFPALNAAEGVPLPLSFKARTGIRADYDPHVDRCRAEIARLTGVDAFRLDGNFDDTFAKLKAAQGVRDDWEERLGSFTLQYFEGLAYHLKGIHVDEDDMVREGFNEAVDKAVAKFRIVDTLKYESYCEVDIEDGVLYLQVSGVPFCPSRLILYRLHRQSSSR
ncbi:hypothetical protein VTK73DRAFT_6660 [Phialemonium thermophilum]|uniref:Uncharacterized protein n=1 Tax=Phialemonium thermophilum TaxID=223376 RepID=A0ABR3WIG6_9PEZI